MDDLGSPSSTHSQESSTGFDRGICNLLHMMHDSDVFSVFTHLRMRMKTAENATSDGIGSNVSGPAF